MADAALAGIQVLEVGNFMAAPFCTMQLADLGADVLKIENPDGGDLVRTTAPFIDGESSSFVRLNRNKRSLALDLKAPRGKDVFRKLAQAVYQERSFAELPVLADALEDAGCSDPLILDHCRAITPHARGCSKAARGSSALFGAYGWGNASGDPRRELHRRSLWGRGWPRLLTRALL